jgi:hypothetical protein
MPAVQGETMMKGCGRDHNGKIPGKSAGNRVLERRACPPGIRDRIRKPGGLRHRSGGLRPSCPVAGKPRRLFVRARFPVWPSDCRARTAQKAPGGSRGTPGRMRARVPCIAGLKRGVTCGREAWMAVWCSCPESPGFHPGLLGTLTGGIPLQRRSLVVVLGCGGARSVS